MDIVSQRDRDRTALLLAMRWSLGIGILMFVMKVTAYILTGSAAILSDAAESVVHVAAVFFAFFSLRLTYKPANERHPYGYAKISFFSSGFEGAMIILAALYIIYESIVKWLSGLALENLGLGTGLTAFAAVINGVLGLYLIRLGKKKNSIILDANGKHVMTDCWTSVGVLVGLGLTLLTGWLPFDPICAILVACNILYSGIHLIRKSFGGLMDAAEPETFATLNALLKAETEADGIDFHALRYRNLGNAYWVEVHLIFPGKTPLEDAHRIATAIEEKLENTLEPKTYVTTHLESFEDHHAIHANTQHGARPV